MEEYEEDNARARALKGKIMTIEKYKGQKPGKLNFKVSYNRGTLTVSLGQAWLAGKRSQDPYALVYLFNPSTGLSLFQIGNNKTRTFDKNIEPQFNSDFVFEIPYNDIVNKGLDLVVAIWDQDSKSRDDYMAGFRAMLPAFPPPSSAEWKLVPLQHQDPDGHPAYIVFDELIGGATSQSPTSAPGSGAGYPGGSGAGYNSGTPGAGYPGGNGSPGAGYPGGSGTPGPVYPGGGTPGAGYPASGTGGSGGYPSGGGTPRPGYPGGSGTPATGYQGGAPGAGYPGGAPGPRYPGGSSAAGAGYPSGGGYPGGSGTPAVGYPAASQGAGYPASGTPGAGYTGAKGAPSPYPGSPYPK